MIRFKSVIAVLLFTALIGCSAQLVERPKEQEASRAKLGRRTEAFLNAHIHISPRCWPNDRGALRSPAQAFCSCSFINSPTDRLIRASGESNSSEDNRTIAGHTIELTRRSNLR